MGKEDPNARSKRNADSLPAKNIWKILEKRKADSPKPDITRPVVDARWRGVMRKINLAENISEYILLDRGMTLQLHLQHSMHPHHPQLRLRNYKEPIRRSLIWGQIVCWVQHQNHRNIWCRNSRLEEIRSCMRGVYGAHENPRFDPISDQCWNLQLKSASGRLLECSNRICYAQFPAIPMMFSCVWDIFSRIPNCGAYARQIGQWVVQLGENLAFGLLRRPRRKAISVFLTWIDLVNIFLDL